MSHRETDDVTGVETTGHEWDGIKELDNPLPRWWLFIFYGCIAVAIVYWVLMPAWPGPWGYTKGLLHQSDRVNVANELAGLERQRGVEGAKLKNASLEEIEKDPKLQAYALAMGQSLFGDNCATCHGVSGTGGKGYANLRDDFWLWGGSLEDIQHTIQVGVRSSNPQTRMSLMPSFGADEILKPDQINDLTEYVVGLSGRPADAGAVSRAAPVFVAQCAICHGPLGKGDKTKGAPDLTDRDWLYGSSRAAIHDQIWNGRGGVMPTWEGRLSPVAIKALTVYVHANAAGQ